MLKEAVEESEEEAEDEEESGAVVEDVATLLRIRWELLLLLLFELLPLNRPANCCLIKCSNSVKLPKRTSKLFAGQEEEE